jgi:hypothetical protein
MATQSKRQRPSIAQQKDIICRIEKNENRSNIVSEYGLSGLPYITNLMKRKEKVLKAYEESLMSDKKTIRDGQHPQLESKMRDWIDDVTTRGAVTTRALMKIKAMEFAADMGITGFSCSDGWLTRFMKRKSIAVMKQHGDKDNVSPILVSEWKAKLADLISGYSPDDVFNADEAGLLFQLQSSQTHAVKGKRLQTGKMSKNRITVLVGCNMSGTEKLPLFIIGKSKNPHCFRGRDKPLMYGNNKKAWMTQELFVTYLKQVNSKMMRQKRKIIMFLDNCSSHPTDLLLSNIVIKFLPANTTSVLQPCDQGVIRSLKSGYRRHLHHYIIRQLEADREKTRTDIKIDLLLAMTWVKSAWESVTPVTIKNCFRKAGFTSQYDEETEIESDEDNMDPEFNEWVSADDAVRVHEDQPVIEHENSETEIEEDEEEEAIELLVKPSFVQLTDALNLIRRYDLFHNIHPDAGSLCDSLEKEAFYADVNSRKQSLITDYMQKDQNPK